jgi:hypothetical protein
MPDSATPATIAAFVAANSELLKWVGGVIGTIVTSGGGWAGYKWWRKRAARLSRASNSHAEKIEALSTALEGAKTSASTAMVSVAALSAEMAAVKTAVEKVKILDAAVIDLQGVLTDLRVRSGEISGLRRAITGSEAVVKTTAQEISELKMSVAEHAAKARESDAEIKALAVAGDAHLTQSIHALRTDVAKATDLSTFLSVGLKALTEALKDNEKSVSKLVAANSASEVRITALEEERPRTADVLRDHDRSLSDHGARLTNLERHGKR